MRVKLWVPLFAIISMCFTILYLNSSGSNIDADIQSEPSEIELYRSVDDGEISLYARNSSRYPLTISFSLDGLGLDSIIYEINFPVSLLPQAVIRTHILTESNVDFKMPTSVREIPGSLSIELDTIYSLPCHCESRCFISQSQGEYTHLGWDRYAIDITLPVGSPVLAMREGIVIEAYDQSDTNCNVLSIECDTHLNKLVVMSSDGALIEYLHLEQNGLRVSVGEIVKRRQEIAKSGNTGFSSSPHLHVAVVKANLKFEQETVPLEFHTNDGIEYLAAGNTYHDASCQSPN